MNIPILRISPYKEWENGVSGCVFVFNVDGNHPIFFLSDKDQHTFDQKVDVLNRAFIEEEPQLITDFLEKNKEFHNCRNYTTLEDYHKHHVMLLADGLLADLLADYYCAYLNSHHTFMFCVLKSDRLKLHLEDMLSNNSLSDTIDSFHHALSGMDWRWSILKAAMCFLPVDLEIHNAIQNTLDHCITHIGERIHASGTAGLALVGEQLSIHMEQHPNDACWYRFVEDYLNDRASIKLLHCSKYSIRQVIAFASLAKHYAILPTLETSFVLEPLTKQERIAIFKMYFQNISETELRYLNEQDDPLCYRLPTPADAQISAVNKMLGRCQFVPFWVPEDVRPTYEKYEWAFRDFIRSEFGLDIPDSSVINAEAESPAANETSPLFNISDRTPYIACKQAFDEIINSAPKRGKQAVLRKLHSTEYNFYFRCTAFSHQDLANELNRLQQKFNFTTNDVDMFSHNKEFLRPQRI